MKLSKAIRKGSKVSNHIKSSIFYENKRGLSTCALGAGFIGWKGISHKPDYNQQVEDEYMDKFPILSNKVDDFPGDMIPEEVYNMNRNMIWQVIIRLNDTLDWSREAIAMWIETLEDYLDLQKGQKDQNNKQPEEEKYAIV